MLLVAEGRWPTRRAGDRRRPHRPALIDRGRLRQLGGAGADHRRGRSPWPFRPHALGARRRQPRAPPPARAQLARCHAPGQAAQRHLQLEHRQARAARHRLPVGSAVHLDARLGYRAPGGPLCDAVGGRCGRHRLRRRARLPRPRRSDPRHLALRRTDPPGPCVPQRAQGGGAHEARRGGEVGPARRTVGRRRRLRRGAGSHRGRAGQDDGRALRRRSAPRHRPPRQRERPRHRHQRKRPERAGGGSRQGIWGSR